MEANLGLAHYRALVSERFAASAKTSAWLQSIIGPTTMGAASFDKFITWFVVRMYASLSMDFRCCRLPQMQRKSLWAWLLIYFSCTSFLLAYVLSAGLSYQVQISSVGFLRIIVHLLDSQQSCSCFSSCETRRPHNLASGSFKYCRTSIQLQSFCFA